MFSSGNSTKVKQPAMDTIISTKSEIVGDLKFTGNVQVEGVIKGNLIAESDSGAYVFISEKGRVEGDVRAPKVSINGTVTGDIYASDAVELHTKAKVNGDVYYQAMEMVLGAQVNGKLHHQAKGTQPKKAAEVVKEQSGAEAKVD